MPAPAASKNRPTSSRRTDSPSGRRAAGPFRRRKLFRHLVLAVASAGLVWIFWQTRSNWVSDMRLWKAVGDASYVLLLVALSLGPLSKLLPSTRSWLRWRRQIGIWFALTATLHSFLILNGWALWSLRRFLGYEFIPQLGREARLEPGFGLANIVGSVALVLGLVLAATSSDLALRRLGRPAWSWLHRLAQTVLVLALLHGGYFLFMHYTVSFHKAPLPNLDWFRIPFLAAGLAVVAMQTTVFLRSTERGDVLTARR
jgi:methionine sulfoxide reductase heme-binding subunit